jgi:hypothetical protein
MRVAGDVRYSQAVLTGHFRWSARVGAVDSRWCQAQYRIAKIVRVWGRSMKPRRRDAPRAGGSRRLPSSDRLGAVLIGRESSNANSGVEACLETGALLAVPSLLPTC